MEISLINEFLAWDLESVAPSRSARILPFLAWLFVIVRPNNVVELGTSAGDSFRGLCHLMRQFNTEGRCFAVDAWSDDAATRAAGPTDRDFLQEYCASRFPGLAFLVPATSNSDATEVLEDGGIDVLHIVAEGLEAGGDIELASWIPKFRVGTVVVVSAKAGSPFPPSPSKFVREISETYPSVALDVGAPLVVAQVPNEGEAPVIEVLRTNTTGASLLFHVLGERLEYRHLLGSTPMAPETIKRYLSSLVAEHAEEVDRIEKLRADEIETLRAQNDRLTLLSSVQARKLDDAQADKDLLLAKIAYYAGKHEQETKEMTAHLDAQMAQVRERHLQDMGSLEARLNASEAELQEMWASTSWRVTRPLRVVGTLGRWLRRHGPPR